MQVIDSDCYEQTDGNDYSVVLLDLVKTKGIDLDSVTDFNAKSLGLLALGGNIRIMWDHLS